MRCNSAASPRVRHGLVHKRKHARRSASGVAVGCERLRRSAPVVVFGHVRAQPRAVNNRGARGCASVNETTLPRRADQQLCALSAARPLVAKRRALRRHHRQLRGSGKAGSRKSADLMDHTQTPIRGKRATCGVRRCGGSMSTSKPRADSDHLRGAGRAAGLRKRGKRKRTECVRPRQRAMQR